jgi:hypothetical protein
VETTPEHCCDTMRSKIDYRCDEHPHPFDCADNLIYYSKKLREYGIIIHDGGNAYAVVQFCPWCGVKLPEAKRQR